MTIYQIDPLKDLRWARLVATHPRASVFHSTGWLETLQRTYGYDPVVFTTAGPGAELRDGIVFCRVQSLLTGRRLVSLPFSEHCEPLADSPDVLQQLIGGIEQEFRGHLWKFLEVRPLQQRPRPGSGFHSAQAFVHHRLDIAKPLDVLFNSFHKSCIQRKIKRAMREQLTYQCGNSPALLSSFYHTFLYARRYHRVPPQPFAWFQNLASAFGDALQVRLALKEGVPVAGILTITFRNTMSYKYGGSNRAFNKLGGMPFLFWKAIQEASASGITEFDLGRSDLDNPGLVVFKERLGAIKSDLSYWRYPAEETTPAWMTWSKALAGIAFARMPNWLLIASGKLLYRHMG